MSRRRKPRTVRLRESATATLEKSTVDEVAETAEPERIALTEAAQMSRTARRRYLARVIEADRWGSSGYYSRTVLERDGAAAWPAGTFLYLDHPTASDETERPERSVRDIAAHTVSTPVMREDGLYTEIEVFPHAEELVDSLADDIGLSIRAAGAVEFGTTAGRSGQIITEIHASPRNSIDFVTRAGAGGKLVALLESAGTQLREARNLGAWLESKLHLALTTYADEMYGDGRLTRDERITLSSAIGDGLKAYCARIETDAPQLYQRDIYDEPEPVAETTTPAPVMVAEATSEDMRQAFERLLRNTYGSDDTYVWMRDYDADKNLVWYDVSSNEESHTWQQTYLLGDDRTLALADDRIEVAARTDYTPVAAISESETTQAPAEDAGPNVTDADPATASNPSTDLEETMSQPTGPTGTGAAPATAPANDTALREAEQARIAAEQARDIALREAADTKRELARYKAVENARPITEAMLAETADFPAAARNRVIAESLRDVPLTESLGLDTEALRIRVKAQIKGEQAYLAELAEAAGAGAVNGVGATNAGAGANTATVDADKVQAALVESFVVRGLSPEAAKYAAAGRE